MWHAARKTTQTLFFALLVATPSMALYDVVQHSRALYGDSLAGRRIAATGPVRGWIVRAQETLAGSRPRNARPLSERLAGTPWALRVGGYTAIDPLNALGAWFAGGGAPKKLLWAALPLLLVTLLFGRVFCGWVCPVHFLLEIVDGLRSRMRRLGVPVRAFRLKRSTKYAVLGLGALATAVLGAQIFPLIYPPAVLGRQMFELVFFGGLGGGAVFLLAVAAVEVFLSRRVWCRSLCPGGALYALLSPLRTLSIQRTASRCDDCGDCNRVCAFGLSPMTDATGVECTSCRACVRVCPTDALALRLRLPLSAPSGGRAS
ncbi:MAG: 4Fe-4S binding protein [Nitrospinota bacterium]